MAGNEIGAETVRIIDPDNVRETFVTGACNVSRAGDYIRLMFSVYREDPEALMSNRPQAPLLVVASRLIMDVGAARGLAHSLLEQLGERAAAALIAGEKPN